MNEMWREVWRASVPLLPRRGLEALRDALQRDDERLLQGATTPPPPLQCVQDWPCEGACAWGYCFWKGAGLEAVADVDAAFSRTCFEVDQALNDPGACRWFMNWYDDAPRVQMRRELLAEVQLALAGTKTDESMPA